MNENKKRQPPDYTKVNKTRRSRGYVFEKQIVNAFNNHISPSSSSSSSSQKKEWHAKRLGGTTTHLPDIVIINNDKSILYSVEAKSGDTDRLYIPRDEIERCLDITTKWLSSYKGKYVVLAFKFKANKQEKRKLQYRFIILDNIFTFVYNELKFISFNIITDELIFQYTQGKKLVISREQFSKPIDTIEKFVAWKF